MNKFIGIGRNTKDGELRTAGNNINVYTNTLAMTNNYKNKDGNYDSEFLNYVAYRNTAEFLNKYTSKGSQLCLEGRIHTRSYEDKDKNKKYVTELIVENITILERKKEGTKEEPKEMEIPQAKTEYDTEGSDVKLSDEDIDKVFQGEQIELPF